MTNHASTLERLSTGSAALDMILGGGIPAGSVMVVAGEPGSGKTVFTLQTLFHHARQGKKCVYFTTLSEPAMKVIRYMQLFSFFDARLIEARVTFVDLGSTLRSGGVEQVLALMIQRVEREEPALVAIDSFKAVHDLLPSAAQGRAFVYDLAVSMAAWGATTLLVGEYTPQDVKARGTGHATELRRFRIDGRGAHVGERFQDLRGVLTGIPQPGHTVGRPVPRRSPGTKSRGR